MSAKGIYMLRLTAVLLILLSGPGATAEEPPLWNGLEAGDHDVGFRRLWELDGTRVWPRSPHLDSLEGQVARPIRVDIWYPAKCEPREPMPHSAYVSMEAPSPPFEDLVFLTRRWDNYSYKGLADGDEALERLMSTPTAACANAPAAPGRFPLAVYSAGWYNRTPDNSVLAEYLASHGFVVAAVPQLNPGLWTYDFRSDAGSVENQVRDVEVALGVLVSEPSVDRRRVAAIGYSTGGDVAMMLQSRNSLIDAVVGLDASWTLGPENNLASWPSLAPENCRVPILAARRPTEGRDGVDDILDRLESAERFVVEIPGANHGSFSDDANQMFFLGKATAEYRATHSQAAFVVLEFLNRALGGEDVFDSAGLLRALRAHGLSAVRLEPAVVEAAGSE